MKDENSAPLDPAVSVVLPTYNRARLIHRAIQSVLNQTYTNLELLVIDDASSDNTEEIVRSFRDSRIRLVRHNENKGGAASRNTGIRMARGKYIAFQDSDDEWMPSKLAIQVDAMEKAAPNVGVVYTAFWRAEKGSKNFIHYRRVTNRSGNIHTDLLRRNFVTTPSILARRDSLFKSGLFDEQLPRLQDWDLVIRLSRDCEFIYIEEPLVISYMSPDSISRDAKAVTKALESILDKYRDEFDRSGILPDHCYSLSRHFFTIHQYDKGLGYLIEGIRSKPRSIGFWTVILTLLPLGRTVYADVIGIIGR